MLPTGTMLFSNVISTYSQVWQKFLDKNRQAPTSPN